MVRLILKLTRGLAPQYQDLTRCVSPPSRWDLQPPKPPPPPPSELLSSLPSSSSSSISRSLSVPPPRLPLPIISASLPSQPPSLSCVATPGEKASCQPHRPSKRDIIGLNFIPVDAELDPIEPPPSFPLFQKFVLCSVIQGSLGFQGVFTLRGQHVSFLRFIGISSIIEQFIDNVGDV